jgi:hypothetical protein
MLGASASRCSLIVICNTVGDILPGINVIFQHIATYTHSNTRTFWYTHYCKWTALAFVGF